MNVDRILDLLDQRIINREVLMPHDIARETFRLPSMIVADHREFNYLVTSYIQHHRTTIGEGAVTDAAAFGEAKSILDKSFNRDRFQEGYPAALQMALDGTEGGMRFVLNELADAMKRRSLYSHMDHVFHHHVDVLSKADNRELSKAFCRRFGPVLERFGTPIEEDTFAWNTRAALEYHRQVIEQITGIG